MKERALKTVFLIGAVFLVIIASLIVFYKWGIPSIVNNSSALIEEQMSRILDSDVKIRGMKLETGMDIAFTVDKFTIDKDGKNYLTLSDIDTLFSIKEILKKRIVVKKILAKDIFVDAYNLSLIMPKQEKKKEKKESPIFLDFYNTLLGVKNVTLIYHAPEFSIDLNTKHAIFDRTNERKYLHLDFILDIKKDGYNINISANDQNRIFMENHIAYIKDFPIEIKKSKIVINALMTNKGKYNLNISAKNFSASDVADIVNSNLIVANGSQLLESVKDINGKVDFNIQYEDNKLNGDIRINEVNFKVKPILDMPVKITKGEVKIGEKDIDFVDFKGYYNNKKTNTFSLKGYTKDYQKTCDTKLDSDIFITNDLFKNYLSKMLGAPVQLVGDSMSKLIVKTKNGSSIDVLWFFLLRENHGFKFGEQSMVLEDYKTFFKVDLSVIKNILKINTIDYHITKEMKRGMTPLVQINGNLDMADNMKILDLNMNMPRSLPSEFLNFIACQKIFKKGTVSGNMHIDNHGAFPTMSGEFNLDKVFIPAQRLYIRKAKLKAEGNKIALISEGRFRREQYKFDGYVVNELRFPIIVKDVNLTVENIDVEKLLTQGAGVNQGVNEVNKKSSAAQALVSTGAENEEESDVMPPFQKGLIVIEKCGLNLLKGVYKEINFGNVHADMTLDKDGILKLKSNRFDIADGISTLRVNADLVNQKYSLRLGVKEVDSNIMATAILGLPRQISGKAKGLIDIHADKSLKLNGDIKFEIKDGTIEQVGYVEYILKVASLFRNPLAMFSPSTVIDLVNIPDGRFDEIKGEMKLEDNVIKRMKITSRASELTSLIYGRYDLTTNDASLRIYTKFSGKGKGFAGALRNISLNTLATKLSISARNERNYYANELEQLPKLEIGEEGAQVFLTKIDGDVLNYNFLSSLKRIK